MRRINAPTEQAVLKLSIWCTLGIALLGVVFGVISRSQAIIFDGVFAVIDAGMSCLALFVSRLLMRAGSDRFQYGYWHLEPLAAFFNGAVLLSITIYAMINGITAILRGGNPVAFEGAALYAALVCAACFVLYAYQKRVNRKIKSEFIAIDMKSFLMSGCITLALFLGFGAARVLALMGYPEVEPYADGVILLLVAIGLLPVPIGIIKKALKDVFLIAPAEATAQVFDVMQEAQTEFGFKDFNVYIAKIGRMHMIDIHVLVPESFEGDVGTLDGIRADIAKRLTALAHLDEWLSITFTRNPRWT